MKDEFSQLYAKGGWKRGDGETASGSGSTLNYTAQIRKDLPVIFEKYNVKTLLDAPCGDFNWFSHIDVGSMRYIGMDIVDQMVADNTRKHGNALRRFVSGDASSTPFPKADMLMCRDLMRHIKLAASLNVLRNFVEAGIPWLLATSYVVKHNADIDQNFGSRAINLRIEPFHLPKPRERIYDSIEGFRKRYLCVWSRDEVAEALRVGAASAETRAASGGRSLDSLHNDIVVLRDRRRSAVTGAEQDETLVILETLDALIMSMGREAD